MNSNNLVKMNEILSARKNQTQSKLTERFLNFKCKTCNGEFVHDSHCRHRNGVAGEPPAGASLPSSTRDDARRSPAAASPPSRSRGGDAGRLAPSAANLRRRSGESSRTIPALLQKTRAALWRFPPQTFVADLLAECCLPRCSQLRLNCFHTVGCIMRVEMRGERFAVMNKQIRDYLRWTCRPHHR